MSDFGGGFEPGISSQGGSDQSFDPSAGGGQGGGFDPFGGGGGDMGMGGWSPFSGGGGSGMGGGFMAPQNVVGTAFDPTAQSAQQGQQAQQDTQKPQGPSHFDQLQDAIKNLVGGPQHMLTPSLQSLANTAKQGVGWFTQNANPGDTTGLTSQQPQGPQNDPGSVAGGMPSGLGGLLKGLFPGAPPEIGQDWQQIMKDLGVGGATPAGASTGPTGNEATQAAQQPLAAAASPVPFVAPEQLQAEAPTAGADATPPTPDATGAAPDATSPQSSAATPPPQLPPAPGDNSGQPGPGDQVTGSQSSAAAAGQSGQYGGQQQWQNSPVFALMDLLRGDFGSFMKDMLGQQGTPANQNQAAAPRPANYGAPPGSQQGQTPMQSVERPRQFAAGPGLQQITPQTDPLTTGTRPGAPLSPTASAAPPSGTPSAVATPQDATAAAKGSSAQPAAPGRTQPVPQASAAQRAALGLPPAPGQQPAAAAAPSTGTNAVPTTRETATPGPQASLAPTGAMPDAVRQNVSQPLGQNEIQYASRGATGRPSQPSVDRRAFQSQVNDQTAYQLAWMINGEVGRQAPLRAKIVQGETAFNRAQMRNQPLTHVLMPSRRRGDAGYYDGRSANGGTYRESARPSAADVKMMKEQILPAIMGGSNLSDVGFGPMTGNASAGVAMHQFQRGTQGYKMRGGDTYFREGPFRPLPSLPTQDPALAQAG